MAQGHCTRGMLGAILGKAGGGFLKHISQERFNAYCMLTKDPLAEDLAEELAWYADDQENVIAAVFRDRTDGDHCHLTLARDEAGRYRCIDVSCGFESPEAAASALREVVAREASKKSPGHGQDSHPTVGLDLFTPVVDDGKLHPSFKILSDGRGHSSGREIIREMMPHLEDVDGNFVEQFQTTGFDARLWELYLFAYLREERLGVSRPRPAPDFRVERFGEVAYIEAVIAGPSKGADVALSGRSESPKNAAEVRERLNDEIPIRFGSPLYSKLKKEYWKLHDIGVQPLVLAIADFHAEASMLWTSTGLQEYLYGTRHDFSFDEAGSLVISPLKIEVHQVAGKVIPSGFFFQPHSEHISAVLFSNSGTISKFTRMGKLAGFGDPAVKILRLGTRYLHDPNAALPARFAHDVAPGACAETWGEGVSIFHNPHARSPLPEVLFPSVAHHKFVDGQIRSHIPEFHPFGSVTTILIPKDS